MSPICKVCREKEREIETLNRRVRDILKAAKDDKQKFWKAIKVLCITIGILIGELILVLARGKDGIVYGIDLIKDFIK